MRQMCILNILLSAFLSNSAYAFSSLTDFDADEDRQLLAVSKVDDDLRQIMIVDMSTEEIIVSQSFQAKPIAAHFYGADHVIVVTKLRVGDSYEYRIVQWNFRHNIVEKDFFISSMTSGPKPIFAADGSKVFFKMAYYHSPLRAFDVEKWDYGWQSEVIERCYNLAVSRDGSLVAAAVTNNTVQIFDGVTGETVGSIDAKASSAITFALDGSSIATAYTHFGQEEVEHRVHVWDLGNLGDITLQHSWSHPFRSGFRGVVHIKNRWLGLAELTGNPPKVGIFDVVTGDLQYQISSSNFDDDLTAKVSRDGNWITSNGYFRSHVYLTNPDTGRYLEFKIYPSM